LSGGTAAFGTGRTGGNMNYRKIAGLLGGIALLAMTPASVHAAEAVNCVDQYLSCINVASQETGDFWRSAKEFECGVDYYACMRRKMVGA
jgi:hypothetical protein